MKVCLRFVYNDVANNIFLVVIYPVSLCFVCDCLKYSHSFIIQVDYEKNGHIVDDVRLTSFHPVHVHTKPCPAYARYHGETTACRMSFNYYL